MLSKDEEVRLWHQKLGHLNLQGMNKAISLKEIRGIPKLQIIEGCWNKTCLTINLKEF